MKTVASHPAFFNWKMAIVLIPSSWSGNKASEALATQPLAQRLVGKATKVQVQAVSRKDCPLQGQASTFLQASASAKSILHRDKETGPAPRCHPC